MSALDRVLLAAGSPSALSQGREEDPAGELVLAAVSALSELRVLLAAAADEDNDDDSADDDNDGDEADDNDDGGGHADHPAYKALIKKKVDPKLAAKMCAKSDKKVKASALCEAAVIALAGLDSAPGNWVELTALDSWTVALAGDSNTSQGAGENYTDPGYQKDGKKRYPVTKGGSLDATRIRSAWSYINQEDNAGEYSSGQVASIKSKIKAAAKKAGVQISDDSEKVAASMVQLASKQAAAMMAAEAHAPFHGTHSHAHVHGGDNMHGPGPDRPDNHWRGGGY